MIDLESEFNLKLFGRRVCPKLNFTNILTPTKDNARNVTLRISLRWPIHIINPDDKTKETQRKRGICTPNYSIRVINIHAGSSLTLQGLLRFHIMEVLKYGLSNWYAHFEGFESMWLLNAVEQLIIARTEDCCFKV